MSLKKREVLIVDDDPAIRKLVKKILEGSGIGVCDAEGVKEAIMLAERRGPHAVITDLSMPEHDGFTLLEKRKNFASLKKIPIMVLSALGDKKSIFRAMSLGAADYIVKPFTSKELLQKLRKMMKDQDFSSYRFAPGKEPEVSLSTSARVLNLTESSFLLEAPIKIASDKRVEVGGRILEDLGFIDCHMRTKKTPGRAGSAGLYLNQIEVVGIPEEKSKGIRSKLRGMR